MSQEKQNGWLGKLRRWLGGESKDDGARPPITIPEVTVERPSSSPIPDTTTDGIDPVFLRQQISNHLDLAELEALCAELDVDYDALSGGKGHMVLEFVQACQQQGKLVQLLETMQRLKPEVKWQLS